MVEQLLRGVVGQKEKPGFGRPEYPWLCVKDTRGSAVVWATPEDGISTCRLAGGGLMGQWFRYLPRRWEVVTRMITGVLHGDAQAMGLRGIGNKPSEIELVWANQVRFYS